MTKGKVTPEFLFISSGCLFVFTVVTLITFNWAHFFRGWIEVLNGATWPSDWEQLGAWVGQDGQKTTSGYFLERFVFSMSVAIRSTLNFAQLIITAWLLFIMAKTFFRVKEIKMHFYRILDTLPELITDEIIQTVFMEISKAKNNGSELSKLDIHKLALSKAKAALKTWKEKHLLAIADKADLQAIWAFEIKSPTNQRHTPENYKQN